MAKKKNHDGEEKARPTTTGEEIDISFPVNDKDAIKVPALTAHLIDVQAKLEAFDALVERADEVNEEIAGRLAAAGISEHMIGEEKHRVRRVNGSSPPKFRLYPAAPKKPKATVSVDIENL